MPISPRAPQFILAAVKHLYPELPALIGEDQWEQVAADVDECITILESHDSADQHLLTATKLVGLLSQHGRARTRLSALLVVQEAISRDVADEVASVKDEFGVDVHDDDVFATVFQSMRWEVEPESMPMEQIASDRSISIKPGGLGGGKSIKFKNLRLDLGEFSKLAASAALIGQDAIDSPKPFVIAASVLIVIQTLYEAMTEAVAEQEASVFWGFAQVAGARENKQVTEAEVLAATNAERKRFGFEPMSDNEFRNSLAKLEQLMSIERVAADVPTWRVVESYRIRA